MQKEKFAVSKGFRRSSRKTGFRLPTGEKRKARRLFRHYVNHNVRVMGEDGETITVLPVVNSYWV